MLIGITGKIGSGKTTLADYLKSKYHIKINTKFLNATNES